MSGPLSLCVRVACSWHFFNQKEPMSLFSRHQAPEDSLCALPEVNITQTAPEGSFCALPGGNVTQTAPEDSRCAFLGYSAPDSPSGGDGTHSCGMPGPQSSPALRPPCDWVLTLWASSLLLRSLPVVTGDD